MHKHFSPIRLVTAATALAAVSACGKDMVAPTASVVPTIAGPSFSASAGSRPALTANSVKYRDAGSKPSTGRSGSASIMSRALLGKDGVTLVEATTGALDGGANPGQISKAQTKHWGGDSTITQNFNGLKGNGYFSTTIPGLTAGSLVQVQTNVRGIDPKRTDVVTVVDSVKLRPDVAVTDLAMPAQARVNTVVNVSATIGELNGDVGARANCILSVDGTQVDQALGLWVDAGDAVTCAFVTTFTTVGTKNVTISATGVVPGDWDMANNAASKTISIVTPETRLNWNMQFYGHDRNYSYQYSYYDWWYGYYSWGYSGNEKYRNAHVYGYTNDQSTPLTGAVTFSSTLSTDGTTLLTETLPSYSYSWYGYNCRYMNGNNSSYQICEYPWGTQMSANQHSGRHVYYGWEYYYYYGYYSYSSDYSWGLGSYAVGSNVAFDVKATDANGNVWRTEASTPVSATPYSYSCNSYWWYYNCTGGESGTQYSGWNSGN